MLDMEAKLEVLALRLTALEQLMANCPRCFGPTSPEDRDNDLDYIVCIDGNFQQRRHEAASKEQPLDPCEVPSLFLPDHWVSKWAERTGRPSVAGHTELVSYLLGPENTTICVLQYWKSCSRTLAQINIALPTIDEVQVPGEVVMNVV